MKLNHLIPMLETIDLEETIQFYSDFLGFECQGVYPDADNPYWCSLRRDNVVIRNEHSPLENPVMTGSLYPYPDDVEQAWEMLKDKVTIEYPLEVFEYGMKEFGIRDPNGYLVQFGQAVPES